MSNVCVIQCEVNRNGYDAPQRPVYSDWRRVGHNQRSCSRLSFSWWASRPSVSILNGQEVVKPMSQTRCLFQRKHQETNHVSKVPCHVFILSLYFTDGSVQSTVLKWKPCLDLQLLLKVTLIQGVFQTVSHRRSWRRSEDVCARPARPLQRKQVWVVWRWFWGSDCTHFYWIGVLLGTWFIPALKVFFLSFQLTLIHRGAFRTDMLPSHTHAPEWTQGEFGPKHFDGRNEAENRRRAFHLYAGRSLTHTQTDCSHLSSDVFTFIGSDRWRETGNMRSREWQVTQEKSEAWSPISKHGSKDWSLVDGALA